MTESELKLIGQLAKLSNANDTLQAEIDALRQRNAELEAQKADWYERAEKQYRQCEAERMEAIGLLRKHNLSRFLSFGYPTDWNVPKHKPGDLIAYKWVTEPRYGIVLDSISENNKTVYQVTDNSTLNIPEKDILKNLGSSLLDAEDVNVKVLLKSS